MVSMIIFLLWIGLAPLNLRSAKRKSYSKLHLKAFALLGGPFATLFFALAERPEEDQATGLLIYRHNRKASLITTAAVVIGIAVLILVVPQPSPGEECHRLYGYDQQQELGCLAVAFSAQRHAEEDARAREWRATH